MRKRTIRARSGLVITSAILTLLLLAGLTSCNGSGDGETTTESITESVTESASTDESESESESETLAEPLELPAEGGVVVSSVYATSWEKEAATTVQAKLKATGVINDTDEATGDYRVVIGYTKLNADLGADFDAIGDLGYMVKVVDNTVLIAANTESGMNDAMDAFNKALVAGENGSFSIDATTNLVVVKQSDDDTPTFEGAWGENIGYANAMQNQVQAHYTNFDCTKWQLSNTNVILNCDLERDSVDGVKNNKTMYDSITNVNGVPYMLNTGVVYLKDAKDKTYASTGCSNKIDTNMYEMGFYYNNVHIQDLNFTRSSHPLFNYMLMETNLNLYSDKLNVVQHIVCTKSQARSGLAGYGQYFQIDAERVRAVVVHDKRGLHESFDDVDWASADYVAFDIERAGIIGFILLDHVNSGKLTVTLKDGVYTIDQSNTYDSEASIDSSFHLYFGMRMYTDAGHSFDNFLNEAAAEREPLDKLDGDVLTGSFLFYDPLRGAYKGTMPTVPWGDPENPNRYSLSTVGFTGDELNRKFYYYTDCCFGALECATILDENMSLLPIALEVTKNFGGENEEPVFYPGDMHYGNTYLPITLNAGEEKEFTLIGLNQNWGNTPLKQLSSIQFFSAYFHLSLGRAESNCISPYGFSRKDYWTLPDFRSVGTSGMTQEGMQYPAHSVIKILMYKDINGVDGGIEDYHHHIDSYGPIYADVTMDYLSDDKRLHVTYRHTELPNEDENRTLYQVRIDILEDITFADFAEDVQLSSFDGRGLQYGTMTYLNENNEVTYDTIMTEEVANNIGVNSGKPFSHDRFVTLSNQPGTYYGYFNAVNTAKTYLPNFALIIKSHDIQIGGEAYTGNFLVRDYFPTSGSQTTSSYLTLNIREEVTLKAGDYIYIDMILLPWGRQYEGDRTDPNETDAPIHLVRETTVDKPFTITAEQGTVIEDIYVPKVTVDENGVAKFTVKGGASNGVVRVYGLTSYAAPDIQEVLASGNEAYSNASSYGYDGYIVYAEDDGTYSVAFVFNMDNVGEEGRTFIVKAGK